MPQPWFAQSERVIQSRELLAVSWMLMTVLHSRFKDTLDPPLCVPVDFVGIKVGQQIIIDYCTMCLFVCWANHARMILFNCKLDRWGFPFLVPRDHMSLVPMFAIELFPRARIWKGGFKCPRVRCIPSWYCFQQKNCATDFRCFSLDSAQPLIFHCSLIEHSTSRNGEEGQERPSSRSCTGSKSKSRRIDRSGGRCQERSQGPLGCGKKNCLSQFNSDR